MQVAVGDAEENQQNWRSVLLFRWKRIFENEEEGKKKHTIRKVEFKENMARR